MVRSSLWIFLCLTAFSISTSTNAQTHVTRDGYVTHIDSPSSFRLNQHQVITTPSTTIKISTDPPIDAPFSIDSISPGAHITVNGIEDKQTHVITAKKVDRVESSSLTHISGLGAEDRTPTLVKESSGWRGTVYADGYEFTVDPKSKIQLPQS